MTFRHLKVPLKLVLCCLWIYRARILTTLNASTPTITQAYQRPQPLLAPAPPSMAQAMATIPQQPAYRAPTDRIFYMVHTCQPACLNRVRPVKPDMHRGKNPLLTPLLYDFRRMTGRRKVNRKVTVDRIYGKLAMLGTKFKESFSYNSPPASLITFLSSACPPLRCLSM